MTVAVLLPVYRGNTSEQFHEALLSIINQNDCPEQVRIYLGIDGQLTDSLERVIIEHQYSIYHIERSKENIGPTRILNRLIKKLKDERLIFRMDADDIALPGRLRKQLEFMDDHPDIHILGTAIEEYNTDTGEKILRIYPSEPEIMSRYICIASPLAHPAVCLRPEIFDIVGGYPDIRGQDLALWIEALAKGYKISNLEEPLLRLRVNPSFFQRRRDPVRMLPEFKLFIYGVWRLHGISWRYIFPLTRLFFRLLPSEFARYMYSTNIRNRHVQFGKKQ